MLKGALIGWILRSDERIPGVFPISPKWRFVLFGLAAIQFARHPEGLVEHGKRQVARPDRAPRSPGRRPGPAGRRARRRRTRAEEPVA